MNRRTKVLLIIFILLVLCGSSLIFSYFYLNHKMTNDILNIAKSSVISTEQSTVEQELETENKKTDTTDAEYMDALTGEFADIGKDQKVKKVKDYVNVLEIPQYDILAKIYPDVSRTSLAYGVGHYPQTVEVGKKGNCAIAGHSSVIYDCILNEVKNMQILDSFNVYDKNGKKHVYYVKTMKVVEPTDMYVLDTTDRNRSEFTIITCTNGGKQRLVINAFEMTKEEIENAKKEEKETKLLFMQNEVNELSNKIEDVSKIYNHNYSSKENLLLKKDFSAGCLIRYLLHSKSLKNKHNVYFYDIDMLLKGVNVK